MVAVEIGKRNADAALEEAGIRPETPRDGAIRLVDDNRLVRPVRRRGPGRRRRAAAEDDLRFAVAVEVAGRE